MANEEVKVDGDNPNPNPTDMSTDEKKKKLRATISTADGCVRRPSEAPVDIKEIELALGLDGTLKPKPTSVRPPLKKTGSSIMKLRISGKFGHYYQFSQAYEEKEKPFVFWSAAFCAFLCLVCVILSFTHPDSFGSFYPEMWLNFLIVFFIDLAWRFLLSGLAYFMVPKFKRTINYTRKLGNLMKLYKYLLADDLLPQMRKEPLTLLFIFALDQLIYIVMYSHNVRKRHNPVSSICRFLFIQQDRPEDRPDTLIYQVTEDIMRFAVYIPFKLFVVRGNGWPEAIVYIPVTVNALGDGLAEPVGVFFSGWFKSKFKWDVTYRTKSLWTSEGGFWSGSFRRSFPGSFCVFAVTAITLVIVRSEFNTAQFWFLMFVLPYWMTMTEAFAPHTNDGPALALVGCGLLSFAFMVLDGDSCS